MKLKAEMGAYSSVVGNSVHLIAEDGRMLGQVAILCHTDDLRDKDVQTDLCRTICDAINARGGSSKWGPDFPPSTCTAWEDCAHDGICHDQNCGAPSQHDCDEKGGDA